MNILVSGRKHKYIYQTEIISVEGTRAKVVFRAGGVCPEWGRVLNLWFCIFHIFHCSVAAKVGAFDFGYKGLTRCLCESRELSLVPRM